MAYYLVRAKPQGDLDELRARLDSGEIRAMPPFGVALTHSLENARRAEGDWITWEEEDYCHPPLDMERQAVLDTYFTELSVEPVDEGSGWAQIEDLPRLWG